MVDSAIKLKQEVSKDIAQSLTDLIIRAREANLQLGKPLEWGGGRECDLAGQYVYLIRATNGLYKIGHTSDLVNRLETLRTMSPIPLEYVHTIQHLDAYTLERLLHLTFANERHHGEWFALDGIDIAFIRALNKDNATLVCTGSRGLYDE